MNGATLIRNTDMPITFQANIAFQAAAIDTGGWWDPATPTDIIVPAGVSFIILNAHVPFNFCPPDALAYCHFRKNGNGNFLGRNSGSMGPPRPILEPRVGLTSGPVPVVEGDRFQVNANCLVTGASFVIRWENLAFSAYAI